MFVFFYFGNIIANNFESMDEMEDILRKYKIPNWLLMEKAIVNRLITKKETEKAI